jgi:acyl carrier protein
LGLESVELTIAIEDEFGIAIPDAAAERMTTVGILVDYVHALFSKEERGKCRTARVFYELRAALLELLHLPRSECRPHQVVETIIPKSSRRRVWKQLNTKGIEMPRLDFPASLRRLGIGATVAALASLFAAVLGYLSPQDTEGVIGFAAAVLLFSLLGALLFIPLTLNAFEPFRRELPAGVATLGDLTREICQRRGLAVPSKGQLVTTQSRDSVALRIREIISEQLGIPIDQVTEDKRFVEDFGF